MHSLFVVSVVMFIVMDQFSCYHCLYISIPLSAMC